MKEKLKACFERLQTLDIKPTQANIEKILQTLYDLRDVYAEIEVGGGNGNATDSTK